MPKTVRTESKTASAKKSLNKPLKSCPPHSRFPAPPLCLSPLSAGSAPSAGECRVFSPIRRGAVRRHHHAIDSNRVHEERRLRVCSSMARNALSHSPSSRPSTLVTNPPTCSAAINLRPRSFTLCLSPRSGAVCHLPGIAARTPRSGGAARRVEVQTFWGIGGVQSPLARRPLTRRHFGLCCGICQPANHPRNHGVHPCFEMGATRRCASRRRSSCRETR